MSGDAHGAGLLSALREMQPSLTVSGVGGPQMHSLFPAINDWVADAAVMGIWEVLKHYSWFKKRFAEMLLEAKTFQPDVLLLIDYPGFNLRFAEAVKRELPKTKIVYYISPQVWAWNKGRIPKMAKLLDEMLCLFPFEEEIFSSAGLKTTFVGHPLVDELEHERIHTQREENLIGLFPGSREREVSRLFPTMIAAALLLEKNHSSLTFRAPAATPALAKRMREMLQENHAEHLITVQDGGSHALMQTATCAVIASGTATLEAAYYQLPYLLCYKVAWLTYFLGRMLVKVPHIGLVNILAGKGVVEEIIQHAATAEAIAASLEKLLLDKTARQQLQEELALTAAKLGGTGAHVRAAARVAAYLV